MHMLIVIPHASRAKINQQFRDSVASDAGHAGSGTDAIPLDQGRYHLPALVIAQLIHIEHYA
jgi:hypothetical protein